MQRCAKRHDWSPPRPGTRNDVLNRAAFSLGQLVAVGLLPPLAAAEALASPAERAGLPPTKSFAG